MIEQRRQNASDAKAFRAAHREGRILEVIRVEDIRTDSLPRDRIDLSGTAASDEMEELKSSIKSRGQKEPIEVFKTDAGIQLKKGWRRLTAIKQLLVETGDQRFATVTARVSEGQVDRIDLYIDMVEENVIREDLTFAEMAQVAIAAAKDSDVEGQGADALVGRLYASLHKMKRSYIRSFVALLKELGDVLPYPKSISRNLGVEVARRMQTAPESIEALRDILAAASSVEAQTDALMAFCSPIDAKRKAARDPERETAVKYEFHVGGSKVTARNGECRILADVDFTSVDKKRLQVAIEAFYRVLKDE